MITIVKRLTLEEVVHAECPVIVTDNQTDLDISLESVVKLCCMSS